MNTPREPPSLCLLGAPTLRVGGRSLPFTAERPFLLLALLACRGAWVRRDELADLLYPGRDLAAARSNLRKVLHLARHVEGVDGLEQQGDLLRWAPDTDLARFEAACGAQQYEQALAAYGGPLLLGLDGAWPAQAAEWLHAERQRLHARWHEACTRRLAQLTDNPAAASELAQALLRADPLDDTALQALGLAQLALGRPAQALSQLRGFEQRLSEEAGLQPSAAVRALGEALQGKAGASERAPAGSAIVGRRQELAQIAQRLSEPGCHVLTLLGAPGSGKSALARAVHTARGASALWVALEDVRQADEVPGRVAALLQLPLESSQGPWAALAGGLGTVDRLLVLDNAEHLDLAPGLETLLASCPGLRVLVTSRIPVGVAGEWRLPVTGLPLPDLDETDPEVLRANDAVLLFERRARPLAPAFDLAAEAADVVRLVHEVEGLPLAIELLAAWRRLMPVREILAELAESMDLLEPAVPSERSVRASFAKAWEQLGPLEQRVLAQMAVLPGPFSRAQVRAVLQAPLPVVAALADRSLLRAEEDGLFTLHPLIRRCAAPLATDVPALRERHARELAQRLLRVFPSPSEAPHLHAAMHWALDKADAPVLRALAAPSVHLVPHRQLAQESLGLLARACEVLEWRLQGLPAADGGAAQREVDDALVEVLIHRSALAYNCGLLSESMACASAAEARAQASGQVDSQARAKLQLARALWQQGQFDAALPLTDAALALERSLNPMAAPPSVLGLRALLLKAQGRYEEARETQETLLADIRRRGTLRGNLFIANNLGNLLRLLGRHQEALALLHEALDLSRTPGDFSDEPFLLTNIALVHETLRDHATGVRWATQALAVARERGEPMIEIAALAGLARQQAALGQPLAQVLPHLAHALAIARRLAVVPMMVECVASAGVLLARGGQRELGLALVRWAQRQPMFVRSEREDAERHIATLNIDPAEEAAALRLVPPETPLADVLARLPL